MTDFGHQFWVRDRHGKYVGLVFITDKQADGMRKLGYQLLRNPRS